MTSAEQEAFKAAHGYGASSLQELRGTGPYASSPSPSSTTTQRTAQGQLVTITHAGAGKVALSPEQKVMEDKRISEEVAKHGYYTPLEYNASSDEYYQTAPELSPSRYIQTPDSEEGRRIIARHPAGELAYEGSASWITPAQAEAKLKAGIASGEYSISNIGYMDIIGVRAAETPETKGLPMGVRTYQRSQAIDSLIGMAGLSGPGESPKRRELITGSIIGDLLYEGYVKPTSTTEKGFNLEYTESGKQMQSRIVDALNKGMPSDWLMLGSTSGLQFTGMPYTLTTTKEGGKTTTVKTDYYGKEIERTVEDEIGALAGPSSGKSVAGFNPFERQPVVHPFVEKSWEKIGYGIDMGVSNPATGSWNPLSALSARTPTGERILSKSELLPGFTVMTIEQKQAPPEPTAMERWLTPLDTWIEESKLPYLNIGLGTGRDVYNKIKSDLDKADISGLDFNQRVLVNIARSNFFSGTTEAFLTAPETFAKLLVRVAPAPGIATKAWIGQQINEIESEYSKTAVAYGTLIGAGVAGYSLGFAGSARTGTFIPQAAAGVAFLVEGILPGYLGMNLWGAPAEVATRGISGFIAARKMPKKIDLLQFEKIQGNTFTSLSRYRTDVGQLIPDEYARISPDKYSVFSGKSALVPDDELASVYGGQGIVQGEPGKFVGVGRGTLTKEFEMYGYNVRGFAIDSAGFQLTEGKAMVGFNVPATVVNTPKGPVYYPRSDVELLVLGKGTPSYSSTYGLVRDTTALENYLGIQGLMNQNPMLNAWKVSGEGTSKAVGGMVIVSSPYSGKAYTIPLEGIIIPIEPSVKTAARAGIESWLGIVGPSAGGYVSGGTSGGGSVLTATKMLTMPRISGGTIAATTKAIVASERMAQAGVDFAKVLSGGVSGASAVMAVTKPIVKTSTKTMTIPKISQTSIYDQISKTSTTSISKMMARTSVSEMLVTKQPQLYLPKTSPLSIPRTATTSITDILTGQIEIPKVGQVGLTDTILGVGTIGIIAPPIGEIPPPPTKGPLYFNPFIDFGGMRNPLTRSRLPKSSYKPSLAGILFGKTATRAPKFITGAEPFRPMVVARKKKKHKRRR